MAVYRGNKIVSWVFYGTKEKDLFDALIKLAKSFEQIFSVRVLTVESKNNFWKKIRKINELNTIKKDVKSNYLKWPFIKIKGNPKLKTINGFKVVDYPELIKIEASKIPKYIYGIEFWSMLWAGSKTKLSIRIFSDDWFLSTTDLSSLELFNKCLAEAKEKLKPEKVDVYGPADSGTMRFAGLFNENGFDIEKIKKMDRKEKYKDVE